VCLWSLFSAITPHRQSPAVVCRRRSTASGFNTASEGQCTGHLPHVDLSVTPRRSILMCRMLPVEVRALIRAPGLPHGQLQTSSKARSLVRPSACHGRRRCCVFAFLLLSIRQSFHSLSFCTAGKDTPVSALPPHEVESWRQNHMKRPLCGCFGSFCVST
jgi:hypothetical protein